MHPQAASLCKKSLVISYTNTLHPTCNLLTRKKQLSRNWFPSCYAQIGDQNLQRAYVFVVLYVYLNYIQSPFI